MYTTPDFAIWHGFTPCQIESGTVFSRAKKWRAFFLERLQSVLFPYSILVKPCSIFIKNSTVLERLQSVPKPFLIWLLFYYSFARVICSFDHVSARNLMQVYCYNGFGTGFSGAKTVPAYKLNFSAPFLYFFGSNRILFFFAIFTLLYTIKSQINTHNLVQSNPN